MIRIDEPAKNLARQQELERQLAEIHARHMDELLPIMNELSQLKSHMYPSVDEIIEQLQLRIKKNCYLDNGTLMLKYP